MSYDIWFTAEVGGPEPVRVGDYDFNMTSNVAPMWRAAGADLAEMHGKPAGECAPILAAAIAAMEADPGKFRAMNPANGWGDYAGCLEFLRQLREAMVEVPLATVQVWR